jgi:hypothetical protein
MVLLRVPGQGQRLAHNTTSMTRRRGVDEVIRSVSHIGGVRYVFGVTDRSTEM